MCSKNHAAIVHDEIDCPLCDSMDDAKEYENNAIDLLSEKEDLEKQVLELEDKASKLEANQ